MEAGLFQERQAKLVPRAGFLQERAAGGEGRGGLIRPAERRVNLTEDAQGLALLESPLERARVRNCLGGGGARVFLPIKKEKSQRLVAQDLGRVVGRSGPAKCRRGGLGEGEGGGAVLQ